MSKLFSPVLSVEETIMNLEDLFSKNNIGHILLDIFDFMEYEDILNLAFLNKTMLNVVKSDNLLFDYVKIVLLHNSKGCKLLRSVKPEHFIPLGAIKLNNISILKRYSSFNSERMRFKMLKLTADLGLLDIIKYLMSLSVIRKSNMISTLFAAVNRNHMDLVKYLVEEENVDLNSARKRKRQRLKPHILQYAKYAKYEMVKYFINKGVSWENLLKRKNPRGQLYKMCTLKRNTGLVNYWLDTVNIAALKLDELRDAMFLAAGHSSNVTIMKKFVGVNVMVRGIHKNTLLHTAAIELNLVQAEILLELNCEVDAVNKFGETSLHAALLYKSDSEKQTEMINLLLRHGAKLENVNFKKERNLWVWLCKTFPSVQTVQLFHHQGLDLDLLELISVGPHSKQKERFVEVLQFVLDNDVNVYYRERSFRQNTVLHILAAKSTTLKGYLLELLVGKHQADINALNWKGQTPLAIHLSNLPSHALMPHHYEETVKMVNLFLSFGAGS